METFPLTPDFPVTEAQKYNTLVSTYDNGVEQRRSKWATPLREFTLTFKNRELADYTALVAFYQSMLGSATVFTFTNPNDTTGYNVRFKEDSLKLSLTSYQRYTFEIVLIEVK